MIHHILLRLVPVLLCAQIACTSDAETCQSLDDCQPGQLCRLTSCVWPRGTIDAPKNPTPRQDERDRSIPSLGTMDMQPDISGINASCGGRAPHAKELVIHEALMSVPPGLEGDANADGVRDAYDDEFIEVLNITDDTLNLKGVRVGVGTRAKWTFKDICLKPAQAVVLFGGPKGTPPYSRDEVLYLTTPTRLSMSNQRGTLWLRDAQNTLLFRVDYDDPKAVSYTLWPQFTGDRFVPHTSVHETPFSPGRCADGQPLSTHCPAGVSQDMAQDMPQDLASDM